MLLLSLNLCTYFLYWGLSILDFVPNASFVPKFIFYIGVVHF